MTTFLTSGCWLANLTEQASVSGAITKDDAGMISLVGLATVFSGLVILCFFMVLLTRFYSREKVTPQLPPLVPQEPPVDQGAPAAGEEKAVAAPVEAEDSDEQGDEAPLADWVPEENPTLVPGSLLAGAVMAYHLFERNELALGKQSVFYLDGMVRHVTLLSAGYCNRALVDGEEVVFNISEVASNDATGRKIVPAGN